MKTAIQQRIRDKEDEKIGALTPTPRGSFVRAPGKNERFSAKPFESVLCMTRAKRALDFKKVIAAGGR